MVRFRPRPAAITAPFAFGQISETLFFCAGAFWPAIMLFGVMGRSAAIVVSAPAATLLGSNASAPVAADAGGSSAVTVQIDGTIS